ncbi:MAG TPA: type IV secretory system conjugative DNA transfer family protein [Acidimicrobiales bacterium]|nr:type IV secretory system conjugative DNA transfer family protein [Acidimicrobiales bacterium]
MRDHDDPIAVLLFGVLCFVAAVAGVVWAGAALATVVSGGGGLDAGVADAALAGVSLPGHLSDPAEAWPVPASARIPGPWLYWPSTAVAFVAAGGATAAVLRWRAGAKGIGPIRLQRLGVKGAARFATARDLAPLVVNGPQPGRFILGRVNGKLVATEDRRASPATGRRARQRQGDRGAVALIGPSRSGKTTAAIAGILEWDGPAVLASVKTDLLAATVNWRTKQGEVRVFDPTGCTGQQPASWSPLRDATTVQGAQRAARILADTAPGDLEDDAFWTSQCEILLFALLFTAANTPGRSMRHVVDWVLTQDKPGELGRGDLEPLLQALIASDEPELVAGAEEAGKALLAIWQMDERTRSSVYATAQSVVWPWADPGVAASADDSDVDLDWLCSGPNTLYICAPIDDQKRLQPVFGGLLGDLIRQAFAHANGTGKPLDPPLLVVIDEAGNTPLRSLPEYASTVAGIGILLVTIWQSKAQLDVAYQRAADTILTNHLTKVFYTSASDLSGLELAARLVGDAYLPMRATNNDLRGPGGSLSESSQAIPLAPAEVMRQMVPGDALLIHGTLPPAQLRTRPYHRERDLARRVGDVDLAAPPSSQQKQSPVGAEA